jgi:hypothetical protein
MKKSELQQIIREEIQNALNENTPKYKKGDTFAYKGTRYTVVSDNGYVVNVVDKNGKESTLNHNQISQGAHKSINEMEGEDYYTLYYIDRPFKDDPDFEEYILLTLKASDKDSALEKARKYRPKNWKFNSKNDPFNIKKLEDSGEEYYEEIA